MGIIVELLLLVLDIYSAIVIASAIVTWLIAFEVISATNPQTAKLVALLNRLTDPVYKPIRKYIQPIGGIDIAPIIVLIIIFVIKRLIIRLLWI